jgi:hypothetical protein
MNIKKLLLTAAAAVIVASTGAVARDFDRRPDRGMAERHDHDGSMDRGVRGHDRYWRDGYRDYAHRDSMFRSLREHRYSRFVGDPYWFHGRYVVRTYDRFGRVVFVEVNPYTGGFIGEIRF